MGSLRALVLIASLSACETSGLEVVVLPPAEGGMAPDQIRLFIGLPPDEAASLAPEGFGVGAKRSGWVWVRDPMNSADLLDVSPGDSVSFSFVADSDFTELGAIIAVGYTNNVPTSAGSLFHKKTGVGNVRVFELQLYPAVDPRVTSNRTAQLQVEIWGAHAGDETCVHLFNKRPDRDLVDPHDSAFIVAKDDHDCDGYADTDALECAPEVHKASVAPRLSDLDCATTVTAGVAQGSCVLGGSQCTDGVAKDETECSPSRFCAPASVCTACQMLSGDQALECIREPLSHTGGSTAMAGIKCHVPSRSDSLDPVGVITLCGTPMTRAVPVPLRNPALQCGNAKITGPGRPFSDRLEIEGARFDVDISSACEFQLTASGDLGPNFPTTSTINGLLTIDLDNLRSLALPVQIQVDPPQATCTNTGYCDVIGDLADRPTACLDVPRPTPP